MTDPQYIISLLGLLLSIACSAWMAVSKYSSITRDTGVDKRFVLIEEDTKKIYEHAIDIANLKGDINVVKESQSNLLKMVEKIENNVEKILERLPTRGRK